MSAPPVVVVQFDPTEGPGLLADVLLRRSRPMVIVGTSDVGTLPEPQSVRGVVVLGSVDAPPALAAWLLSCHSGDVPVLALGEGAAATAGALGLTVAPGRGEPEMIDVYCTDEAADDAVFGTLPPGSRWPVTAPALTLAQDAATVLSRDAVGAPVAHLVGGRTHLTRLAPTRHPGELAERLPALSDAIRQTELFLLPHSISFLGRWVDEVAGRTPEETPWGRKGPQPVPGPGLSLHPAQ